MSEGQQQRTGTFQELAEQECYELLETTTVGRVGFASERGQQIIPVNFERCDGALVFATSSTSILAALADGVDDVAFEVDHHDTMYQVGWSVLVLGRTERATEDETAGGRHAPWAPGERSTIIRLVPARISGRRVAAH